MEQWTASDLCQSIEDTTSFYALSVSYLAGGTWQNYLYRDGTGPYHPLDGTDGYPNLAGVNDFAVVAGQGYMVYLAGSSTDDTWDVSGGQFAGPQTISFQNGWNFVAAPYHTAATASANDIMAQINAQNGAGTCVKVANWTTSDTWETWDGSIGVDFSLDDAAHPMDANSMAWAILCNQAGTWTPG